MKDDNLLLAAMEEDSGRECISDVSENTLKMISALANEKLRIDGEIARLDAQIRELKEAAEKIVRRDLPEAMGEAGIAKFSLSDGSEVEVKPDLFISVRKDREAEAIQWLKDHGHGSIVKYTVSISCQAGEEERAEEAAHVLQEHGHKPKVKGGIHANTLRAWGKLEMRDGRVPPEEFFRLFEFEEAKIRPAKG